MYLSNNAIVFLTKIKNSDEISRAVKKTVSKIQKTTLYEGLVTFSVGRHKIIIQTDTDYILMYSVLSYEEQIENAGDMMVKIECVGKIITDLLWEININLGYEDYVGFDHITGITIYSLPCDV